MNAGALLPWVAWLPLASAAVLLLWTRIPRAGVTLLGVGSIAGAALLTAAIGLQWLDAREPFTAVLWQWLQLESFAPRIALHFDGLALTMTGVITGVGALIHS